MHQWGWSGNGAGSDVAATIVSLAKRRGFVVSETAKRASVVVRVTSANEGDGQVLVVGHGIAGDDVAGELSRAFAVEARYAEVVLEDTEARASLREVAADGSLGPEEDLDDLVTETCEDWFEGKKYRSEAIHDLVAICLGLDEGMPAGGIELAFQRASSARVVALLDAIKNGARWERTDVQGRAAIKVCDAKGTRISVLEPQELAELEAGLA
jgi:hypothetical protein